jgi:sugar phosphate permease
MVLSRARWWRITPVLFITYSFAYLDRVNYSFAAVGGIGRDLNVSASTQALIGALFFFGYFAGQIPGAIYAERNSPKKLIFACLILWGVFSTLTGLVSNVTALMVVRFLLGVVEAAVFPSLLIFINHWFSKSERSVANATTVLATPVTVLWMSILSGYLVHMWGWRAMFIAEGLPASLWGIAWWFLVQDRPSQVSWLEPAERHAIEAKIASEQGGMKPVRSYGEAFRSPVVIRLSILYFFWGLSLFGFILWLPTIIRQSGSSNIVNIGWLSAGPYLATTLLMPIISALADRTQERQLIVWLCLAAGGLSFLALYFFPAMGFWPAYAFLSIAGIGLISAIAPFFAIPADILPRNVAGGASAVINALGALGGFVGSYLVGLVTGLSGNSSSSFLLMGVSLMIAVILLWFPLPKTQAAQPPIAEALKG